MTDNEIIKALECCMNGRCDDECPFRETREHCQNLDSLILDLINRQKAEIEKLTNNLSNLAKSMENCECCNIAKVEAYKEYAAKCKECFPSVAGVFDYFLKELVGDNP